MPAEPHSEQGIPSPRSRNDFVGHGAAVADVAGAVAAERLHHAWLIGGPAGIGKATLAFRIARFLLAPRSERGDPATLAVDPHGRTSRQIAAGSHPNLITLDLDAAAADVDKPPARTIPAKTVRRALNFFGSTAADGGHRVCVIDSIDEMNATGANALLKTVEEPPARATILIVTHAPQRVLPTIRSRCRKLILAPLAVSEVAAVLGSLPLDAGGEGGDLVGAAAERSEGSVRRALSLLDPKRMALVRELSGLLDLLPTAPTSRILALAERLGDRKAEGDFALALGLVQNWSADFIRVRAGGGAARLAPLAELCEKLLDGAATVETYNLDRRPFVIQMFGDLAQAIRLAD